VFLQERNREDRARNAVVSVFLRVMEYYSGILFLTTNRVGALDQAFRSRIHLSLYYPALDEEATLKIWEMHIQTAKQRFEANKRDILIEEKQILNFAKTHWRRMTESKMGSWNGRQIRNAFQTAVALAEFNSNKVGGKPHLTGDQFRTVARTSEAFDDYLLRTQGGTVAKLAKTHKLRTDEYKLRDEPVKSSNKKPNSKPRSNTKRMRKAERTDVSESSSSQSSDSSESDEEPRKPKRDKGLEKTNHKDKPKKKSKDESSSEESNALSKHSKGKKKSKRRDYDD